LRVRDLAIVAAVEVCDDGRSLTMDDGIGLADRLLGLPGLTVLDVEERAGEVVIRAESTRSKAVCPSCRRRARAHDRVEVHVRDQHCFGRAARLVISKRRWRCRNDRCGRKTWTERIAGSRRDRC
jgi:transposase IS204/IS1001/IS1096/IS1165 family protein